MARGPPRGPCRRWRSCPARSAQELGRLDRQVVGAGEHRLFEDRLPLAAEVPPVRSSSPLTPRSVWPVSRASAAERGAVHAERLAGARTPGSDAPGWGRPSPARSTGRAARGVAASPRARARMRVERRLPDPDRSGPVAAAGLGQPLARGPGRRRRRRPARGAAPGVSFERHRHAGFPAPRRAGPAISAANRAECTSHAWSQAACSSSSRWRSRSAVRACQLRAGRTSRFGQVVDVFRRRPSRGLLAPVVHQPDDELAERGRVGERLQRLRGGEPDPRAFASAGGEAPRAGPSGSFHFQQEQEQRPVAELLLVVSRKTTSRVPRPPPRARQAAASRSPTLTTFAASSAKTSEATEASPA